MYFLELRLNYTQKWWYHALRSVYTFVLGLTLLLVPDNVLEVLLLVVGGLVLLDSAVTVLSVVFSRMLGRLWKIVLLRELLHMSVAVPFVFAQSVGLVLMAVLLSAILFFRGVIELILFVEVRTTTHHRRLLLLTTMLFFIASALMLVDAFTQTVSAVGLLGIYLMLQSLARLRAAYRMRSGAPQPKEYREAILAPVPSGDAIHDTSEFGPALPPVSHKDHERFFLVPHLNVEKYRTIMIIAPHPDDLEGFCGGLVYRLAGEVLSVIFAGGDRGAWSKRYQVLEREDYIRIRLAESSQAAELLGVREIIYMGYFDRTLTVDDAAIDKTLDQLTLHRPDLVVTFEYRRRANPYPHPDHLATGRIVREAISRYEYADELDLLLTSTLLPNTFVDVTGVRHIKLAALACHTTQGYLNALIFPFFEKLLSRIWGTFAGVTYAEGYRRVNIEVLRTQQENRHD